MREGLRLSIPGVRTIFAPVRGLGRRRLAFLAYVTGGHTIIHWYQQIFAVVLPSISQGLFSRFSESTYDMGSRAGSARAGPEGHHG